MQKSTTDTLTTTDNLDDGGNREKSGSGSSLTLSADSSEIVGESHPNQPAYVLHVNKNSDISC